MILWVSKFDLISYWSINNDYNFYFYIFKSGVYISLLLSLFSSLRILVFYKKLSDLFIDPLIVESDVENGYKFYTLFYYVANSFIP